MRDFLSDVNLPRLLSLVGNIEAELPPGAKISIDTRNSDLGMVNFRVAYTVEIALSRELLTNADPLAAKYIGRSMNFKIRRMLEGKDEHQAR